MSLASPSHIGGRLRRLPRGPLFCVLVALVLVLGTLDTLLPRQLSLAAFLVIPIFIGVWSIGSTAGFSLALLGGLVWFLSDKYSAFAEPTVPLELWDLSVKAIFLLVICALMQRVKQSMDQAAAASRCDELTGIANRRGLLEFAARELERSRRYSRPLTVVYIDVDDFKNVNDRFGHRRGDDLLRGIASVLSSCVRRIDVVARVGGDEFVILLTETDSEAASAAVGNFTAALANYFGTTQPAPSVSIGVVTFRHPLGSLEELLAAADELMYSAKASGKGSIRFLEHGGAEAALAASATVA
jgi:diguanylate cyclase (GGDEF)-like protein